MKLACLLQIFAHGTQGSGGPHREPRCGISTLFAQKETHKGCTDHNHNDATLTRTSCSSFPLLQLKAKEVEVNFKDRPFGDEMSRPFPDAIR